MFPSLTIYTVNADLTLLNAILNGVAMICQQNAVIWGFAMLAAMWRVTSTTVETTIRAGANADTGMKNNTVSAILPFIMAMLLTAPGMKTQVSVESTINSKVTQVSNVPFVIAVIPATVSLLGQEIGTVVTTAYQGTGTEYSSLSAAGNGFINPLKLLLTSRTTIMKMGLINSQVNTVLSSCLGSDFGADYSSINNLVINAGNTGATTTQSISVYDQAGSAPTAIGALLYQASLNTTGMVTDVSIAGNNNAVTCADAANAVAANINTALYSPEFARSVLGAVNGTDQLNNGGTYNIGNVSTTYMAVRTANTTTNTLAGGAEQANAELINLLFAQLVDNDLNCLRADGTNKTTCLAMTMQSNEIERNNIQSAANANETIMYAGQFANYIIALIIGLGPVIVMFMMFAGVGSARSIKTAVHMMVWPILIMDVGAELINGMIYVSTANFMQTIAQGGYLSQATAVEVYKNFSLQVGTASHLIATLPVLMTTIFALGESAALVSISNSMTSNSDEVSKNVAPDAMRQDPLVSSGGIAKVEQGDGFANVRMTGAIDAVSTSSQYGQLSNDASRNITAAETSQRTIAEGERDLTAWQRAFQTGDYTKVGVNHSVGESVRHNYEKNMAGAEHSSKSDDVQTNKSNSNQSTAGFSGGISASTSSGLGGSIGAQAGTSTGAQDVEQASEAAKHNKALNQSHALSKAITDTTEDSHYKNTGSDQSKSLQKSLSTQREFSKTLSDTQSMTDATSEAVRKGESFVEMSGKIGSSEIANHMKSNREFARFQLLEGNSFDRVDGVDAYKEKAERDMAHGATERIVGDDPAHDAAVRHRSAVMMANDAGASQEHRLAAQKYLVGEAEAMQAIRFTPGETGMRHYDLGSPGNHTGVNDSAIIAAGNRLDHTDHPASGTSGAKSVGTGHGLPGHVNKPPVAANDQVAQDPSNPVDDDLSGNDFKRMVIRKVKDTSAEVGKSVEDANKQAHDHGLAGPDADGTVVRTAKNAVRNIPHEDKDHFAISEEDLNERFMP